MLADIRIPKCVLEQLARDFDGPEIHWEITSMSGNLIVVDKVTGVDVKTGAWTSYDFTYNPKD